MVNLDEWTAEAELPGPTSNSEEQLDAGRAMNKEPILITLGEIKHAIAAMKKGKSPGADGLPVEILKAGDECVEQQLLKICTRPTQQRLHQLTGNMELSAQYSRKERKVPVTTTEE